MADPMYSPALLQRQARGIKQKAASVTKMSCCTGGILFDGYKIAVVCRCCAPEIVTCTEDYS